MICDPDTGAHISLFKYNARLERQKRARKARRAA